MRLVSLFFGRELSRVSHARRVCSRLDVYGSTELNAHSTAGSAVRLLCRVLLADSRAAYSPLTEPLTATTATAEREHNSFIITLSGISVSFGVRFGLKEKPEL